MTNTLSSFDEDFKPICHGSPRPLVELASMKMALDIWLEKFDEFYLEDDDSDVEITELDFHIEKSTVIPTKIRKMVDPKMYSIAEELDKWVRYINLSFDQIRTRFNLVVLGGNGTIHFRDTIANYLQDESLDNITKFKIACFNCEEEKIDFFWPLVSSTLRIDELNFENDCMLYYWICRKKGEMDRIPLEGFDCIERRMIYECHSFSMHFALEYFLKSLNTDDRSIELDKLLHFGKIETFTRLIPNMDGSTQSQILEKYTTHILTNFVTCLRPVEYAVQCFLYIRNIITPECYCGEIIIKFIEYLDPSFTEEMSEEEEILWCKRIETTLEQIWLNTPQHLKEYALENLSSIMDEYTKHFGGYFRNFDRDIRFLLAVLPDCDFSLRNNLWIEHWENWMQGVPPCQFEELMGMCLKTEAIEEFKSTLPYTDEFQQYCDMLISGGCFIEFDEFLSNFYSNAELILNIKKHILTNAARIFRENRGFIDIYVCYIENLFSNVVSANNFKRQLIFSNPIANVFVDMGTSNNEDFDSMKYILSLFISSQKYSGIKDKFLELLRDKVNRGELHHFKEYVWSDFLTWCSDGNEQRAFDFMKSVQIDVIFEAALFEGLKLEAGGCERNEFMTCSFNRFLLWFFKSSNMTKNYIHEKVKYYKSMDAAEVARIFGESKQKVIESITDELLSNFDLWNYLDH